MRLRFPAFYIYEEFLINNFQAVHKLVNANEKMKLHIKPHLTEPTFAKLRDSSKLSSIKITNMMSDLVEFINELVDDQIRMRTCIPLTPELKDFYRKLMGRNVDDEDSPDNQNDDVMDDDESERYEKSVARFLTPKKRFTRKVVSYLLLLLRLSTRFINFLRHQPRRSTRSATRFTGFNRSQQICRWKLSSDNGSKSFSPITFEFVRR